MGRSRSAPSNNTQSRPKGGGGQQFQPPTTSGAGSQMGGGLDLWEQPGLSNEFMQDMLRGGPKTDVA